MVALPCRRDIRGGEAVEARRLDSVIDAILDEDKTRPTQQRHGVLTRQYNTFHNQRRKYCLRAVNLASEDCMFPKNQPSNSSLGSACVLVEHLDINEEKRDYHFDLSHNNPTDTFSYRILKRSFDIAFVLLVAPLVLGIGLVIALCITLDSPGPVFFSHSRVKRGGEYFHMWKFRTMCCDAGRVLEQHLERHSEDRKEWKLYHKLRDDPRVSKYGAFLRKKSLDELPQIWNVLMGTMSLVGPRPIVRAEIPKYGSDFVYYTSVKPGITGLWQSSGRSSLTYEERVALDRFYFENWSLWLEAKIQIRTIWSVLGSDGAY